MGSWDPCAAARRVHSSLAFISVSVYSRAPSISHPKSLPGMGLNSPLFSDETGPTNPAKDQTPDGPSLSPCLLDSLTLRAVALPRRPRHSQPRVASLVRAATHQPSHAVRRAEEHRHPALLPSHPPPPSLRSTRAYLPLPRRAGEPLAAAPAPAPTPARPAPATFYSGPNPRLPPFLAPPRGTNPPQLLVLVLGPSPRP